MEFPPNWVINEAQDFEVSGPLEPGDLTAELMVQVSYLLSRPGMTKKDFLT
jgi:hypothetical protein